MSAPTDQQILDAYKTALLYISSNQSYTINGRTLTRANLSDVLKVISVYESKLANADTSTDETGTGIMLARFN
jgi:hypothetical protein